MCIHGIIVAYQHQAVFRKRAQLPKAKKKGERWFELNPNELRPNAPRTKGHVWQFLLPAEGMVPFDKDKSIADLVGGAQAKIKE